MSKKGFFKKISHEIDNATKSLDKAADKATRSADTSFSKNVLGLSDGHNMGQMLKPGSANHKAAMNDFKGNSPTQEVSGAEYDRQNDALKDFLNAEIAKTNPPVKATVATTTYTPQPTLAANNPVIEVDTTTPVATTVTTIENEDSESKDDSETSSEEEVIYTLGNPEFRSLNAESQTSNNNNEISSGTDKSSSKTLNNSESSVTEVKPDLVPATVDNSKNEQVAKFAKFWAGILLDHKTVTEFDKESLPKFFKTKEAVKYLQSELSDQGSNRSIDDVSYIEVMCGISGQVTDMFENMHIDS